GGRRGRAAPLGRRRGRPASRRGPFRGRPLRRLVRRRPVGRRLRRVGARRDRRGAGRMITLQLGRMSPRETERMLGFGRERIWRPYATMPATTSALPAVSAEGLRLTLADGTELIDGMSSWWAAVHGYNPP